MSHDVVMMYITCANREQALEIAHALVAQKQVACANIVEGLTSVYAWRGEVQEEKEVLVLAKTTTAKAESAVTAAKKIHPYEIPCITVLPVIAGFSAYLDWVKKEVS